MVPDRRFYRNSSKSVQIGRLGEELSGPVMTNWKAYRVIPEKGVVSTASASLKVKQRSIAFHDIKPMAVPARWLDPLRKLLTFEERKRKRAFEVLLAHLAQSALANYQDSVSATIAHHKLVFKPYEAHPLSVEQGAERKVIDIDEVALEGYLKVAKGREASALLALGVDPEVIGGIEDDDEPRKRVREEYFIPDSTPPHALEVLKELIEKGMVRPSELKHPNALKDLKGLKLVVSERGSDEARLVDARMTNADYLLRRAVAKADCIEIARTMLKLNPLASGIEIATAVSQDLKLGWNVKGTMRRNGNAILRWMLWLEPYVVDAGTSNKASLIAYAVDSNKVGGRGRPDAHRKAMEKELRRLVAEGKTLAEIAETFGVSIGTVTGWKRHYNLTRRGRPRR
jgi:DNA-binding NarL/FixJ family response regulator